MISTVTWPVIINCLVSHHRNGWGAIFWVQGRVERAARNERINNIWRTCKTNIRFPLLRKVWGRTPLAHSPLRKVHTQHTEASFAKNWGFLYDDIQWGEQKASKGGACRLVNFSGLPQSTKCQSSLITHNSSWIHLRRLEPGCSG